MNAPRRIVVIGASLAGFNGVQAAREAGYDGELILIGDEPHAPYDRPPLSKDCLRDTAAAPPLLCSEGELRDLNVTLRLGARATSLDAARKIVRIGVEEIDFDAAVIATGLRARKLPQMPFGGVHVIRTRDDSAALARSLESARNLVVIGGGFIGFETAAIAAERGLQVTVLETLPTPLARAVGETAGRALAERLRQRGVRIETSVSVEGLEGDACVAWVRLADRRRLPADVVIASIGAEPATDWLAGSGLRIDNGVVCDERLNAGFDGVWAAGDVARWPNPFSKRLARVEHWTNAVDQGRHAMLNAMNPATAKPYRAVPYFWSDWSDDAVQFAGIAEGEPQIVAGGWNEDGFVALYLKDGALRGVLTLNRRAANMKFRRLLDRGATATEALALAASGVRVPAL